MLNIQAIAVDKELDLSELALYLRRSGLPHRISENGQQQIIWVATQDAAELVKLAFERLKEGALPKVIQAASSDEPSGMQRFLRAITLSPLTATLVLATIICYPVTNSLLSTGQIGAWLPLFTLTDITEMGGQLRFANLAHTLESGEWWRLWSPMLLHFGLIHIVFNLLWLWELGHRIEQRHGPALLLVLVLGTSMSANLIQYYMYGVGIVGGMSGVVFGLVGYAMLLSKMKPAIDLGVRPAIFIFMLIYLVVGFTGTLDFLGLGAIANGAHLGGLLGGLMCALVLHFANQLSRRN